MTKWRRSLRHDAPKWRLKGEGCLDALGPARNPPAAARMDEMFSDCDSRLAKHPKLGRPGKVPGTRELVAHEHYRLVYEVVSDTVWILTLIHTARLWPR